MPLLRFILLDEDKRDAPYSLPQGFPGTVGVEYHPEKNPAVELHNDYRRYEFGAKSDGDFLWFVENVLSAQNVLQTKFATRKSSETISQIFTIQDEAFALLVLLNEFHCWEVDWMKKNPGARTDTRTNSIQEVEKLFVSKKSGKKHSWDDLGINVFYQLCNLVQERRKEDMSKRWEAAYMYSHAASKRNKEDNVASVETCRDGTNQPDPSTILKQKCVFEKGEEDFLKLITGETEGVVGV